MEEWIVSTYDKTSQPILFFPAKKDRRPLLVGLHTWSFHRDNLEEVLLPIAKKLDWNLLLPEFRGPNKKENPDCTSACGSPAAVQDILDAVKWAKQSHRIDIENLFLLGASGGGHAALLTAAQSPKLWRGCAVFVPITDLGKWYNEKKAADSPYCEDVSACCGGDPNQNPEEYKLRSPMSYVDRLANVNLKLFHGKYDSLVCANHSLDLYKKIDSKFPNSKTFLEIFGGGHQMIIESAIDWFLAQKEKTNKTIQVSG